MSFHRVGHNKWKKAPVWKKPDWDNTVQDLTVFRASPEEIMQRKESHKSKNHMSVKLEKLRKGGQKKKLTGASAQNRAIMKEIFYDQNQLQDALEKSDKMMSVIKDMFGDDPKKFMGFPNVTTAPNSKGDHISLGAPLPDYYTDMERLSDSMMDPSALNDDDMMYMFDSDSDSDSDFECPEPFYFESKLQFFKDYLHEAMKMDASTHSSVKPDLTETHSDKNNAAKGIQGKEPTQKPFFQTVLNSKDDNDPMKMLPNDTDLTALNLLLGHLPDPNFQTPTKTTPPLPSEQTPPSAINDTKKIKRSKKAVKSPKVSTENVNTTTNMNDMRKVLQELENEICSYEHQTLRCTPVETHKTETFSGYTVALVSAVSRLARYLKETDLKVRKEAKLREKLVWEFQHIKSYLETLSMDDAIKAEEHDKLFSEYKLYRENTDKELDSLKNQLSELRHLITGKELRLGSSSEKNSQQQIFLNQQQHNSELCDAKNITKQSEQTSKTSTPLFNNEDSPQSGSESGTYQALPTRLNHSESAVAAVMLSPPVRKTRVEQRNGSVHTEMQFPTRKAGLVELSQVSHEGAPYPDDPPQLIQTLPIVNTVSVPRPIPLVQSNLSVPLTSGLSVSKDSGSGIYNGKEEGAKSNSVAADSKSRAELEQQLQQLQELALLEETLNSPEMQLLMQAQIAELDRQQEEARRKLLDLLDKQRVRQMQLQDQHDLQKTWNPIQKSLSPPISPISQASEKALDLNEGLQQTGH